MARYQFHVEARVDMGFVMPGKNEDPEFLESFEFSDAEIEKMKSDMSKAFAESVEKSIKDELGGEESVVYELTVSVESSASITKKVEV